ncbi:MAG: nucleotide sugar dehydrogenase [Eubacteriales bacterium]|nr:nucleotide sugar dehydrogenase [Eubacteriales bacterium]
MSINTERTAVLGLGYVGLPLALEMVRAGCVVYGIDKDVSKVNQLKDGSSYVLDVPDGAVMESVRNGRFLPTTDFGVLADVDAISICVPTPLRKTKDPDLSYVLSAVSEVRDHLQKGQLVILESTTYPGTTDELVCPVLEETGLKVGKDFFLAFSPERVDPGNMKYTTKNIPKVIGGVTPECTSRAVEYYSRFFDTVVPVSSSREAEMVKLMENTFRAVNIALVNEMALMCDRMGVNVWEVINAAATKPFGYMPFYPGPGIGGHCIPLDPVYLSWKAKTYNFFNRFIDLATDINANMPRYVVAKVAELLNHHQRSLNGAKILLLGVAYKRDINDVRESPAEDVYKLLKGYGAAVEYNDPYVPFLEWYGELLQSVELSDGVLGSYDCVVLITNHSDYNYHNIERSARLILDTRNAFKDIESLKVFSLGAMNTGGL